MPGCVSKDRSPTTKRSGRCNFVGLRHRRRSYPSTGCDESVSVENGMLEEQKAVVIGGTSGIGLAAASELCRAGAQVWVTGRTAAKAMAAATAIGDRATAEAVDARDAVKLRAFFARVREFDHLIVALGGGSAIGAFKDLDEAKMRAGFDNKFWPYINAIRNGVGHIRGSGSITLITGAAGRRAIKGTSGLAAVNGALQAIIGPFGARIRADPRQCGIAWFDRYSLLGSCAGGCPASYVRAFGRERSGRPRRCAE